MAESLNNFNTQIKPPWMGSAEPPASGPSASPAPAPAPEKTALSSSGGITASPFRKIIPFLGIAIILILVAFVLKTILAKKEGGFQIFPSKIGGKKEVVLTYWGLWESSEVMAPLISAYKKDHPEVTINYSFQSIKDYRERLQSALAAGKGPDIFRLHATWLPMFINQNQLSAVPSGLVNWSDYYPVTENLKIKGEYYAVPLSIDTLALFYNVDLFNAASLKPPVTWEETLNAAKRLTVSSGGKIQTAGMALGTTNNVDNWSDILGLMMYQNGANLSNPVDSYSQGSLKFYSLFSRVYRVWDETLPASTYAFATGKAAMMIGPSWRVFEINATNPKLNFKTIPVPQLTEDSNSRVNWATYWVEGVAKNSANAAAAWDFLKFLSQPENLKKLYTNESQVRLFGEPYPLKSLAKDLESHPLAAAFVQQGSSARIWYLCSYTQDNGINDRMIKYFEDAVNSVNAGGSAETALSQADAGVKQILTQYGLLAPSASP